MAQITVSYGETLGMPNYCSKRVDISVSADVPKGDDAENLMLSMLEHLRETVRRELKK